MALPFALVGGAIRPANWNLERDEAGHRTYKLKLRVQNISGNPAYGPATIIQMPFLPQPGQWWVVGLDADLWATCYPQCSIKPYPDQDGEPAMIWECEFTFSTKPLPHNAQRCNNQPIGDPLLEPVKISGATSKYSEEKAFDRFAVPIVNSAFEQIRGHQVEFDASRSTVKIEWNTPTLDLAFIDSFLNTVNDDELWGYPRRCVMLANRHWDRKFYGLCEMYFTLSLDFEIYIRADGSSGFDRDLLDEGTKALHGQNVGNKWVVTPIDSVGTLPNYRNPSHFIRYKDARGENAKCILDGFGVPIHETQGIGRLIYRMSISDSHTPGDINDSSKWVTLREEPPASFDPSLWWQYENTGQGSGATATANVIVSSVDSITLTSGGGGYTIPPLVTITPTPFGGTQATAYAVINDTGNVVGIVVTNEGLGYNPAIPPNVVITSQTANPVTYNPGDLVAEMGEDTTFHYFVCVETTQSDPILNSGNEGDPWVELSQMTNQQAYEPSTSYNIGDYVDFDEPGTGTGEGTTPGVIHVEYYPESDLTLLGIPTDLFSPGI